MDAAVCGVRLTDFGFLSLECGNGSAGHSSSALEETNRGAWPALVLWQDELEF